MNVRMYESLHADSLCATLGVNKKLCCYVIRSYESRKLNLRNVVRPNAGLSMDLVRGWLACPGGKWALAGKSWRCCCHARWHQWPQADEAGRTDSALRVSGAIPAGENGQGPGHVSATPTQRWCGWSRVGPHHQSVTPNDVWSSGGSVCRLIPTFWWRPWHF